MGILRPKLIFLCLVFLGISVVPVSGKHWSNADRSSSGIAPLPEEHGKAVVQIYAARTFGWRGALAVHTWISMKSKGAENYVVSQVVGFRSRRNLPVLTSTIDIPDRFWYGNMPSLLVDLRGEKAEVLIPEIIEAINTYPFKDRYLMWPGPNSNTFTAYIGRKIPELKLDLPSTAIGKDYLAGKIFSITPGGSGYQLSFFGLLGVSLSIEEGVEINILSLNFGVNPTKLQLKLPGIGVLGGKY